MQVDKSWAFIKIFKKPFKVIEINYKLNEISMKNIIEILYKTDLDIIDLSTKEVSLEDVFINLTSNH